MQKLLEKLLNDAKVAHAQYEQDKLGGKHDDQWAGWYAAYMTEQLQARGLELHHHH